VAGAVGAMQAEAVPDIRLLDVLEPELRRKHPVIDKTYLLISPVRTKSATNFPSARAGPGRQITQSGTTEVAFGLVRAGPPVGTWICVARACGDTNSMKFAMCFHFARQPNLNRPILATY